MQEVKEFMEIVNKALPGAWGATIRQMYIYGVMCMITAMITGIGAALIWIMNSGISEDDIKVETVLLMLVLMLACIVTLVYGVLYLMNPEYYAIQSFRP
jgi:hypothetical protein